LFKLFDLHSASHRSSDVRFGPRQVLAHTIKTPEQQQYSSAPEELPIGHILSRSRGF
jgi:hypothetical protein